jgi:hypothetical protein
LHASGTWGVAWQASRASLLDASSYIRYHAARGRVSRAYTARDSIFSARGIHRFCGSDPATISRTRVTRLVSVAFSVAFPCGVSPARRRGRGHIVNSSWRLPPSRDPRPDPHQALAWAPLSTTATPIFYVQPLACRCASHVCSSARAACWRASSTLPPHLAEGFAPYVRPSAIAFAYPNIVLRQPTPHSLSSWRCSLVVNWPHS